MNCLVVVAHPCHDSFSHAAAAAAVRGLRDAGHSVTVVDLYEQGFRAAMSREERAAYDTDEPILDPQVREHADRLREAQILVFVYPTWWSGLPAILKGWLERVMVPGVGFRFDHRGKVRPGLAHVRRIVGISCYGSHRATVKLVNDNGRRVICRALRMSCGVRTRVSWMALYSMDRATDARRHAFLSSVERRMAAL